MFLPGESYGQRSLEGYSPRGPKESDTTEAVEHAHTHWPSKQKNLFTKWAHCLPQDKGMFAGLFLVLSDFLTMPAEVVQDVFLLLRSCSNKAV